MGKDLLFLFFLAALVAFLWRDCRKAARANVDADYWSQPEPLDAIARDIQVMPLLTREQMDELDKYAHMEELAEDLEMREAGFRELELYSYWQWREGKRAA